MEWSIIVAIFGAISVGLGIAATGIVFIASTVITMLIAGASIEAISAAVGTMLNTIGATNASLELLHKYFVV
ncbi:MAG: hypothetical protein KME55_21950 [Nostoc indistinguendum CM1-VF10]|nr:hypothetical protein [Nostoc indistinguendum CM1-VF10]